MLGPAIIRLRLPGGDVFPVMPHFKAVVLLVQSD